MPCGRIFMPSSSALWPQLLAMAHDTGHEGVQKKLHRLRSSYNPHTSKFVRDHVKSCTVCQRHEMEHLHPSGLLQPLDVPTSVWSDIAMDFVEGFSKVGGKSASSWSSIGSRVCTFHPPRTSVHGALRRTSVLRHNRQAPRVAMLNRERPRPSLQQHPTDGAVDARRRQTSPELRVPAADQWRIGVYLRCLSGDRPRSWFRWLPWAEYCYNTSN